MTRPDLHARFQAIRQKVETRVQRRPHFPISARQREFLARFQTNAGLEALSELTKALQKNRRA